MRKIFISGFWLLFLGVAVCRVAEAKSDFSFDWSDFPGADSVDAFEIEPLRERFLARNGRVFGKVFISDNGAEADEIEAALDIADWLTRVAGAKVAVPVENEMKAPRSLAEIPTGIYVGNTVAAGKLGIYAPAGEGETYVIETRGNAVFIVGKTPAATRIAAGEFLREALGVEFVWPGEEGAEWTLQEEIAFPRLHLSHVPAFAWRLIGTRDSAWNFHLGFGELPRFSHNLGNIFSKDVYAENPPLAPIVFGKSLPNFSGGYAPQPNLKNPAAVPTVLEAASAFFEKNPEAPMFPLGINDTTNWDESEESLRAYGTLSFFRNLPNRSDYYYDFVNRSADAVHALNGKSVGVIAYMDVQETPSFPVRKNVVPVLCADRSMWIFPKFKAEDKALIRRWARSGAEIWGVYDYWYGSPFLFPRLFLKEEAEAIKFVYAQGGKIFYAECGAVVPFDAPKIWLASQLFRNPAADPAKILDDYYAKAFGDAAPAMKNFYEFCCDVWKNQGGQCRWIKAWNNENSAEIFPPEKLSRARAALSEAFALLPDFSDESALSSRERRILARLRAVDAALRRAEKFTDAYFARKALALSPMTDFAGTLGALKNPAWHYEDLYDDAEFSSQKYRANISKYSLSDPRPAAFQRVLAFLKTVENPQEKLLLNRALERIFAAAQRSRAGFSAEPLSVADTRLRAISEAVPAFDAEPDFRENFEAESFVAYAPGDWRAGKNLLYPRGWRCILAASEKIELGASDVSPHGGKTALRIGGETERTELLKHFPVRAGGKVLAQIFARGKVSCGSTSCLRIEFKNARGDVLSETSEALPVGETASWKKLVALGEAPAGTVIATVCVYAGLQGPGDETFFDDLTVSVF